MSDASTVYDIKLRWLLEDRTSKGTTDLAKSMERAQSSGTGLAGVLAKVGTVAAGYFGMAAAKKSFVDFNSSMEQSKIGMAGLFEMNMGGEFADNMARSEDLIGRLQVRMKSAVGTTQDAVQMASMLAQPFSAAGASLKQMEDMTVGVVVGSKAMGIAGEVAARDIDQALRGQFHSIDQFTGKLLGAKEFGFTGEAGRKKFNSMSASQRFETVNKALNSKSLQDMAKAQEGSFDGVVSTLQDTLEQMLGKIGLPLFKSITKQIKEWNKWIEDNGDKLDKFARQASDALLGAFGALKDSISFIVEHKDALLAIATAFLAVKAAETGSNLFASGAKMAAKIGGGVASIGGAALSAAAIGAAIVAATESSKAVDRTRREPLETASTRWLQSQKYIGKEGVNQEAIAEQAKILASAAKDYGLMVKDESGKLSFDRGVLSSGALTAMAKDAGFYDVGKENADFVNAMTTLVKASQAGSMDLNKILGMAVTPPEAPGTGKGKIDPKGVHITIHHIEVKTDDPDRFAFSFEGLADQSVRARSAAFGSLRGG